LLLKMSALQGAISIRPARSDDAAALAELSTQLGYPAAADTLNQRLERVRGDGVGEVFVAAGLDGRVLGWTHVVPRLHLEEAPFAELAGLVVADGARGAGVGAALLSAAEQWAREHGFVHFRVRSNVVRERAHRFYLREGYVERKRQVVFDKTLD
jgi:GNAT superfamily N-acetyltransferase